MCVNRLFRSWSRPSPTCICRWRMIWKKKFCKLSYHKFSKILKSLWASWNSFTTIQSTECEETLTISCVDNNCVPVNHFPVKPGINCCNSPINYECFVYIHKAAKQNFTFTWGLCHPWKFRVCIRFSDFEVEHKIECIIVPYTQRKLYRKLYFNSYLCCRLVLEVCNIHWYH